MFDRKYSQGTARAGGIKESVHTHLDDREIAEIATRLAQTATPPGRSMSRLELLHRLNGCVDCWRQVYAWTHAEAIAEPVFENNNNGHRR